CRNDSLVASAPRPSRSKTPSSLITSTPPATPSIARRIRWSGQPGPLLGEELDGAFAPYDIEVSTIEGKDATSVALRTRDDRRVREPEGQIRIAANQGCDPRNIVLTTIEREDACCKIVQEEL